MKSRIDPTSAQKAEIVAYEKLFGVEAPFYIDRIEWNHESGEVHFYMDFERGAKFDCSSCGAEQCAVLSTTEKTWKTLPIHHYTCFIHLRTPYIKCSKGCCKSQIFRPHWENGSSSFTIWFENDVIGLVRSGLPVSTVAKRVGEHDSRIWRIVRRYVEAEYAKLDFSKVKRIAVDEICIASKYKFVTIFTDIDTGRVLFIADGKKGTTFWHFKRECKKQGLNPKNITDISMDMSAAFIKGATTHFPNAEITFDKFHVLALLNKAVNEIRKTQKEHKDCMYELYKRSGNLTTKQAAKLKEILAANSTIAQAYEFKETFYDIMNHNLTIEQIEPLIDQWIDDVWESCLEPLQSFVNTLLKHWYGVVQYFKSRITNGIAESINSIIRTAQCIACGIPNRKNFKSMVYLKRAFGV